MVNILLLLVGLGLVVLGADWLVNGASSIARRAGISEFVIGLTIVGFGTSCPELVVSLSGAIEGNSDISVGNVVGSNIFNVLFILGLTAMVLPVGMTDKNRRIDIPITLGVTILLVILGITGSMSGPVISRWEGVLMLLVFSAYLFYCFKSDSKDEFSETQRATLSITKSIALTLTGLAGLIFGGDLFVDSATALARQIGVSDKFIAVTILAGGTSLPELATSLVAAIKGKEQLALGNILGSNVFNAMMILGLSSVITPLSFASMTIVDIITLVLSAVLLLIWAYTGRKNRIDRREGAAMLLCYVAYNVFLFSRL
ncbi:MAG: calcium/sodium antiporter [Candidatus Cryptobacteroides sp.]|nr:calcium/sodium antiporter [Candidatus Cryptobacteroides sp.]